MRISKKNVGLAWTWKLEDGSLCYYSEATRPLLLAGSKPSPGAKPVSVYLVERRYLKFPKKKGRKK